MNYIISVIVPVYNQEKYIERCISSITSQTYSSLEIVVINDCSTDRTLEKLNNLAKKDNRIKIYTLDKNRGGSFACGFGIEKSKGEFFTIVDSDDYIDSNYLEVLYNNIQKNNADISMCVNDIVDGNKIYHKKKNE